MLEREHAPFPLVWLFSFMTTAFLLSLTSIFMLVLPISAKFFLVVLALSYFLKIVQQHIITPQPMLTYIAENEYHVTTTAGAFFASVQPDSIVMRWLIVLRLREVGGQRSVSLLRVFCNHRSNTAR